MRFDYPLRFELQITKHWSKNEKPEMSLDRLQLIATAMAPHHHKARWLSFWNSGTHTGEALYFPAKGFKTEELEAWLNKASFWTGVRYYSLSLIWLSFYFATFYWIVLLCPTFLSSI
jgi:arginine exporter protein ArgO